MLTTKKILLKSIRTIFRLFGVQTFVQRRTWWIWRLIHYIGAVVSAEKSIKSMNEHFKSVEKEKMELAETLKIVKQLYEGRTDEFVTKKHNLPGILFNTLPKSGSVYIARTLANSPDIEYRDIKVAHGFFSALLRDAEHAPADCPGERHSSGTLRRQPCQHQISVAVRRSAGGKCARSPSSDAFVTAPCEPIFEGISRGAELHDSFRTGWMHRMAVGQAA